MGSPRYESHTFVRTTSDYCLSMWDSCACGNINKPERIKTKAAKFVAFFPGRGLGRPWRSEGRGREYDDGERESGGDGGQRGYESWRDEEGEIYKGMERENMMMGRERERVEVMEDKSRKTYM